MTPPTVRDCIAHQQRCGACKPRYDGASVSCIWRSCTAGQHGPCTAAVALGHATPVSAHHHRPQQRQQPCAAVGIVTMGTPVIMWRRMQPPVGRRAAVPQHVWPRRADHQAWQERPPARRCRSGSCAQRCASQRVGAQGLQVGTRAATSRRWRASRLRALPEVGQPRGGRCMTWCSRRCTQVPCKACWSVPGPASAAVVCPHGRGWREAEGRGAVGGACELGCGVPGGTGCSPLRGVHCDQH